MHGNGAIYLACTTSPSLAGKGEVHASGYVGSTKVRVAERYVLRGDGKPIPTVPSPKVLKINK